jgi:hypothetical protein
LSELVSLFLAFIKQQPRCGNVESRVLCGFPSSEGGNENAFTKLTLPPSERHFHSEAPGSAASLSDFAFRQHSPPEMCIEETRLK